MEHDGKREVWVTLAVLFAIAIIAGGAIIFNKQQAADTNNTASTQRTPSGTSDGAAVAPTNSAPSQRAGQTYKDGAYRATGQYDSPGGNEAVTISLTLENGVVTDTSAEGHATDGEAREYQSQFVSNYKKQVVGKKIDEIKLSRVSGSSLTSQGFNRALEQIESEAVQKG